MVSGMDALQEAEALRQKLGLSVRAFALRFGLNPRTYAQWATGQRKPDQTAQVLLRLIVRHPDLVQRETRRADR